MTSLPNLSQTQSMQWYTQTLTAFLYSIQVIHNSNCHIYWPGFLWARLLLNTLHKHWMLITLEGNSFIFGEWNQSSVKFKNLSEVTNPVSGGSWFPGWYFATYHRLLTDKNYQLPEFNIILKLQAIDLRVNKQLFNKSFPR